MGLYSLDGGAHMPKWGYPVEMQLGRPVRRWPTRRQSLFEPRRPARGLRIRRETAAQPSAAIEAWSQYVTPPACQAMNRTDPSCEMTTASAS